MSNENQTIDSSTLVNALMGIANLAKDEEEEKKLAKAKKLKENREMAKAHLAKLEEDAEKEEDVDESKAKKLRMKARKLKAKLAENEEDEVDLAEYKVDEASLGSSTEVKTLQDQLTKVTIALAEVQANQVKLAQSASPSKEQVMANLIKANEEALALLKGNE